jgi:CRISPR/Cas system type I-B associated protein Csh2 (Cas7 group RAMP superfamily)
MATTLTCDYCGGKIEDFDINRDRPVQHKFSVTIFDSTADKEELNNDACSSCADVIRRLLGKSIDRLKKALDAASDR